ACDQADLLAVGAPPVLGAGLRDLRERPRMLCFALGGGELGGQRPEHGQLVLGGTELLPERRVRGVQAADGAVELLQVRLLGVAVVGRLVGHACSPVSPRCIPSWSISSATRRSSSARM